MILKVENLCKAYGATKAVDNISLKINQGEVFGLLGPNGSGKTTTLGIILGVTKKDQGSVSWFSQGEAASHRKKIGSLLEKPNFTPWLSGLRNLFLVASIKGITNPEQSIRKVLESTGLWEARSKRFSSYSLGMKQRLAIAATMLGDPEVLVLDEPTNGIDAAGITEIRELITEFASRGKTVILASHILDEVEKVCSHVAIMKKGQVLQSGAINVVLSMEDHIEVGASDRESLKAALNNCPMVSGIKDLKSDKFQVVLKPDGKIHSLNKYLTEKGQEINHLCQRQKSLEAHFLELLEQNNA